MLADGTFYSQGGPAQRQWLAVAAVDSVTETFGVNVEEVTDPTVADVTLSMDTASAVGGYADGVLGCTTDAAQITIISGWDF